LGVSYTVTSTFVPGPGNVYDVFLTVDPTSFSAGTGFLDDIVLAFKTGSDVPTSVSLLEAPGGVSAWSNPDVAGGADKNGCNGNGSNSGDVCFADLGSAGAAVKGGPYTFELAVTMPGTDALTSASDIKATYNTSETITKGVGNLGLTSMGITIQASAVPEPSYTVLLGAGVALLGLVRKFRRN
jgi:hypothetical protein